MTVRWRTRVSLIRLYLASVLGLSGLSVAGSLVWLVQGNVTGDVSLVIGLVVLIAFAATQPVKLRPHIKLAIRIAPQLTAALLLPPALALLVAGIGVLLGYVYLYLRRRSNPTDLLFNTAQSILSTAIAGLTYQAVMGAQLNHVQELLALVLSAEAFHLSNFGLVAGAIAISGQDTTFRTTFLKLIKSYPLQYAILLVSGILGALLVREAFWAVSLLVVLLFLVERTFVELQRDAEQERKLAADNARLFDEARSALHQRDEFLAIAAHELKTPITTLLGYLQLMQRRAANGSHVLESDQHVIHLLAEQGSRLHRLSGMLLDLSHIRAGQFTIACQPVDMCSLAQRIVDETQRTLKQCPLYLTCPDEALVVQGDELRLEQVIQNLLQNAIKYSPAGGPILVRIERRDDQCLFMVRDHGIGIPQAELPHIFEQFYQVQSRFVAASSGFGIGLYVVNEIVTRHGGRTEVTSIEGRGSTFTIYLPLTSTPLPNDKVQQDTATAHTPSAART
ncbi:MAG: hypothetical protein CYG59_01690 [Chloroflexi bacterium]|nr:MAG: hypothetical protein CYG59_01690 [Chloroflexota bacterium]